MLHFHGDERVFWRTMNPARCHALYGALLKPPRKAPEAEIIDKPKGLRAYLTGGG